MKVMKRKMNLKMKRKILGIAVLLPLLLLIDLPSRPVYGQLVISQVISAGVKRVIKAVDLRIQRLQNKTIWLQNAQKTLENTLAKFKLDEISLWSAKHKEQYRKYYQELLQVKSMIRLYSRIRETIQKQVLLVKEYGRIWRLLRKDRRFTAAELGYMGQVYEGILAQSLKNIELIELATRSFSLQMTDADRLELIHQAGNRIDQNYQDLLAFNQQNIMLRLHRAKDHQEMLHMKQLYGLTF